MGCYPSKFHRVSDRGETVCNCFADERLSVQIIMYSLVSSSMELPSSRIAVRALPGILNSSREAGERLLGEECCCYLF